VPSDPTRPASSDALDEDASTDAPGDAPHGARVNAPRAGGPRKTPRPTADPALRAARPVGKPSSLPPPGFVPLARDPGPAVADRNGEGDRARTDEPVEHEAGDGDDRDDTTSIESIEEQDAAEAQELRDRAAAAAARRRPPAPVPGGPRRGRRVKRVIRRIDLWSVLKLALVVYACLYAAVLGALAALWGLAYSTGSVDKLESFLADVGLKNFHFYGDQMFKACAAIGAVAVLAGTVFTVLAVALINVISEITGGIRLTVIEEDV
jgi:hypothetical protein